MLNEIWRITDVKEVAYMTVDTCNLRTKNSILFKLQCRCKQENGQHSCTNKAVQKTKHCASSHVCWQEFGCNYKQKL